MKCPWRPLRLSENLKEFCIKFLYVLLCFVFSKTWSNFLPMLSDVASVKSLEMYQLMPKAYVIYSISTEKKQIQAKCVYMKVLDPCHKRNFIVIILVHLCTQTLLTSLRGAKFFISLFPFHNKYQKYKDVFITPAVIHTS